MWKQSKPEKKPVTKKGVRIKHVNLQSYWAKLFMTLAKQSLPLRYGILSFKLLRAAINYFVLKFMLYPAQSEKEIIDRGHFLYESLYNKSTGSKDEDSDYRYQPVTYERNDYLETFRRKVELKGFEISAKQEEENLQEMQKMHAFYIPGNGMNATDWEERARNDIEDAKDQKVNLTAHLIDPRGCGASHSGNWADQAYESDLIVNDYYKMMKYKIDNSTKKNGTKGKANAHHFSLITHSLGAGLGSKVAAKLHAHGYKVLYHNSCSFRSTGGFVAGQYAPGKGNGFFRGLIRGIVNFITKLIGWKLSARKHTQKIDELYRSHSIVKEGKGKNLEPEDIEAVSGCEADGVIPYYGSLHHSQKAERIAFKAEYKLLDKVIKDQIRESGSESRNGGEVTLKKLLHRRYRVEGRNKQFSPKFIMQIQNFDKMYNNSENRICGKEVTGKNSNAIRQGLANIKYWYIDGRKFQRHSRSDDNPGHCAGLDNLEPRDGEKAADAGAGDNAREFIIKDLCHKMKFFSKPKDRVTNSDVRKERKNVSRERVGSSPVSVNRR